MRGIILKNIRRDLRENIDKEYKKGVRRFYKEKVSCYGVRTPVVRSLAKKYKKDIFNLNKTEVFKLAEDLFKNSKNEEATIAVAWLVYRQDFFIEKDFFIFEKWLVKYIDNWSKCDDFCLHITGPMIYKYPKLKSILKNKWTISGNRWLRRASAVSFIKSSREGYFIENNLNDVFIISERLWQDGEDLVRKGCGWMLKSASVKHPKEIINFLKKNKEKIHHQVLTYALEKYSISVKKKIR